MKQRAGDWVRGGGIVIIRRSQRPFPRGYTAITELDGEHREMRMDFGILKLEEGESLRDQEAKERAFLLMTGNVRFEWEASGGGVESGQVTRRSLLDEKPSCLHVPAGVALVVTSLKGEAELAVQKVSNSKTFPPRLWRPGDYRSDRFGEGTLQNTSTRDVCTIFDAATVPNGEMVMGEVINYPGKWSSYPPHDHAQPEVYHYRFFPEGGFGHAEEEDQVFKVRNYDTYVIPPKVTHSQCAAPGYVMYYIWMIPHLPEDRFGPDSRVFRREHAWVMDATAPLWPDAPLAEVLDHYERTVRST